MRCWFPLLPNSSIAAVEHCTYMQRLGVLNEPHFIYKTRLTKITLCNDDGILQVRLQGVTIIDLVPQKHKVAEQRDTEQCDCTEGHKNAFTIFILFWYKRLQVSVALAVKLIKHRHTEQAWSFCNLFLLTSLPTLLIEVFMSQSARHNCIIITGEKEIKASRPKRYLLSAKALAPVG